MYNALKVIAKNDMIPQDNKQHHDGLNFLISFCIFGSTNMMIIRGDIFALLIDLQAKA